MNPFLLNILLFLAGFVFLNGGAEFLVRGASRFAVRLNVPLVVIGLTIVAFGTSLPELLVSLIANLEGGSTAEISIGNVVGSNIANLALILGMVNVNTACYTLISTTTNDREILHTSQESRRHLYHQHCFRGICGKSYLPILPL